jgi:hypothetical protein
MKAISLSSSNGAVRNALIAMAAITMLTIFASPAMATTIHFGVRCQSDFQNGWAPTIDVYGECDNFISQIGASGPVDFYFNLHGAQNAFYYGQAAETCDSCGGVDSVDFFYMSTHGGDDSTQAVYAMWDASCPGDQGWPGCIAQTPDMRIGSSGKQAKALATFSCDTFYNADGNLPTRWGKAFAGGLKIGVGGHDLLYTDNDTQAGTDFALYMQENSSIGNSWLNAVYYANTSNQPAIANTGANSSDCWNRQGVTLGNLMSEKVLRDGAIGYYCWSNWN